jgi:two-component system chemotaxis response regulator CheB
MEHDLPDPKLVVIGTSAGGVDALMTIVRELPRSLPAPILVVLHVPADSPSLLASILNRQGGIPAKTAQDGERYASGTIYVAPPDHHLLVEDGFLRTVRGPRENRHRPAIDPLFRSAALARGPNAIGVILTGSLDDGTAGLLAIKNVGGTAIVQDPRDAVYPAMPASALEHVKVDYVVPLADMAGTIVQAVNSEPLEARESGDTSLIEFETRIAEMDPESLQQDDRPGRPSAFSCPDCGGVLWEVQDGDYTRFRCRVGHAFSPETMLGAQSDILEEAMWTALKTLEESARLSRRLAANERARGHDWMVKRFEEREEDARAKAEQIRQFLTAQISTVPVEAPLPERRKKAK